MIYVLFCNCFYRIEYFLYQKEKGVMSQLLDLRIRIAKRDIQMHYYLLMLWIRHKLEKQKNLVVRKFGYF